MLDVLTAVLVLALVGVWLAALGRSTMPRAERLPVGEWRVPEVLANIAIGYRQLVAVHERMRWTAGRRDRPGG